MNGRTFKTLLVLLVIMLNIHTIGYCSISQQTLNSMCIDKDSWVIPKLYEKIQNWHGKHIVPENESWKESVRTAYVCTNSGSLPESDPIDKVLYGSNVITLNIPIKIKEIDTVIVFGGHMKFKKMLPSITSVVNASKQPTELKDEDYEIEIENLSFGTNDGYLEDIKTMATKEEDIAKFGFTLDEETTMYSIGMERYTYGYILVDKSNKKLFWCKESVQNFEKGNFYDLNEVLNAFKEYTAQLGEYSYYYTH